MRLPALEVPLGDLRWGVKASFRSYVASLSDGACRISAEVRQAPDGRFAFPIVGVDAGNETVTCGGAVAFTGHDGALDVSVADLELRRVAGAWELWGAGLIGRGRQLFATGAADVADAAVTIGLRLAPAGVALFDGNYPVGASLDAVEIPRSAVGAWC